MSTHRHTWTAAAIPARDIGGGRLESAQSCPCGATRSTVGSYAAPAGRRTLHTITVTSAAGRVSVRRVML